MLYQLSYSRVGGHHRTGPGGRKGGGAAAGAEAGSAGRLAADARCSVHERHPTPCESAARDGAGPDRGGSRPTEPDGPGRGRRSRGPRPGTEGPRRLARARPAPRRGAGGRGPRGLLPGQRSPALDPRPRPRRPGARLRLGAGPALPRAPRRTARRNPAGPARARAGSPGAPDVGRPSMGPPAITPPATVVRPTPTTRPRAPAGTARG
jgi:hypothetical protein